MGIEKIISAYDADTGYRAFLEHEPDVSVIDLSLSHDTGAKTLVFSMRSDRNSFMSAIEVGATGYLIKDSPIDEFANAMRQTQLGRRYIDSQLALNLVFSQKRSTLAQRTTDT
jgi:DNA-binding NarL/FixJ family response regulator